MPEEIDHERWRRFAAFSQPNHPLAQPYLDLHNRLDAALEEIKRLKAEIEKLSK